MGSLVGNSCRRPEPRVASATASLIAAVALIRRGRVHAARATDENTDAPG
jgi:hypothetical protein